MHFLINSTLSLDVIAMAMSIAIVVWSYQIKNGNSLAKVGGVLLFIIAMLSMGSTFYYGGKFMMKAENMHHMLMEHKMMEQMKNEGEKAPE